MKIFKKNLNYFKQNYPGIFEKIKDIKINEKIDKNLIKALKSKAKINSNKILNNTISNSINLIQTKPITFKKAFDYEIDSYKFINEFINNLDINKIKLKKFKVVVAGINLGFELNYLNKKNIKAILILEHDLNLIFLSLFFVKYYKLKPKIFINEIKSFLDYKYKFNHFVKYIKNEKRYLEEFVNYLKIHNPLNYTFSEYLGAYKKGLIHLNKYKILDFKNSNLNLPILFLGAGQSLEKNIAFVKQNKDKFLIVAIGSILHFLQEQKITPDIILSIDGSKKVIEQFSNLDENFYKIPAIISFESESKILEKLKNIYLIQTNLDLINDVVFSGVSVADIGLKILSKLSNQNIFLLGFDLGGKYLKNYTGNTANDNFTQIKYQIELFIKENNIKNIYNLSYSNINGAEKIGFNNLNLKKIEKNFFLYSKKIDLKKDDFFIDEIIKRYKKLIKPYLYITKKNKIYKQQLKLIKNF